MKNTPNTSHPPLVDITGLCVEAAGSSPTLILDNVSLRVQKGSVLGIVGESGSGKSTLALSMLGHFKPGLQRASGRVAVAGHDILSSTDRQLRELRSRVVAYVPQNAGLSLTPTRRIGALIGEVLRVAGTGASSAPELKSRVVQLLKAVRLSDASEIASRYPHQLSGGQQQRCAIAMAIAGQAGLLILDEPTSALDAATHNELLALLRTLVRERSLTVVCITHDMRVVSRLCSHVAVMQQGRLVEQGLAGQILRTPQHPYTRKLLSAQPLWQERNSPSSAALPEERTTTTALDIRNLTVRYSQRSSVSRFWHRPRRDEAPTLQDLTFSVRAGKIIGVIGESGSGKSTLLRSIAGAGSIQHGRIILNGTQDLAQLQRRPTSLRQQIQLVWQNPLAAINPRQSVFQVIDAPLRLYFKLSPAQRRARASELLGMVQLTPDYLDRFPGQLSGGQAQRVAIARACAAEPEIMLCDEITSALDVSVQAAVLSVIRDIRAQTGCTFLFVSHDLAVVASIADEIIVLHNGRICEAGTTEQVLTRPAHWYTQSLVQAFGATPDPAHRPGQDVGENFHPAGSDV